MPHESAEMFSRIVTAPFGMVIVGSDRQREDDDAVRDVSEIIDVTST